MCVYVRARFPLRSSIVFVSLCLFVSFYTVKVLSHITPPPALVPLSVSSLCIGRIFPLLSFIFFLADVCVCGICVYIVLALLVSSSRLAASPSRPGRHGWTLLPPTSSFCPAFAIPHP